LDDRAQAGGPHATGVVLAAAIGVLAYTDVGTIKDLTAAVHDLTTVDQAMRQLDLKQSDLQFAERDMLLATDDATEGPAAGAAQDHSGDPAGDRGPGHRTCPRQRRPGKDHRSVGQVNTAMTQMSKVTQQNASASEELAATAEELTTQHASAVPAPRQDAERAADPAFAAFERFRPAGRTPMDQPATTLAPAAQPTLAPAAPTTVPAPRAGGSPAAQAIAGAGVDRYLTFALGGELYALSIIDVVEIIEYRALTTVPRMPDFIRGVLNLRGAAVPVVDLSTRFGREATSLARRTGIVIVDIGREGQDVPGRRLGILVDAVNKVLHVSGGDIEPPPDLGTDIRADAIRGMAKHEEQFIVILDLEHLLANTTTEPDR
jgi:purine-binding chemotaxis protein CheW